MRIAHFVQRYPPALGGSEAFMGRLSRHLAAAGHDVTVFTSVADDLEAFWSRHGRTFPKSNERKDGVWVRRYPLWRWPGRRFLLKALSLVPSPWQALTMPCNPICWGMWHDAGHGRDFDIVHATAFPYAWPIACGRRLAARSGVPFVVTPFLHLGDPANPNDPMRRAYTAPALVSLLRAARMVFVQTHVECAALRGLGLTEDRLALLGMGVEPAECTGGDRTRARQYWDAAAQEVVIGHLANLSREKGTIDLLQAADRLWQQGESFRVVLAGPEMANFRRFWREWRPRGPVTRLGVLTEAQKRDFFAGIDLFALPSRSDSFGLVLLEAWANGIPSVAYRAGGVAEVIQDQEDGLLAPCGDSVQLAQALRRLVRDCPLRERLGSAGRKRTASDFHWPKKLKLVEHVYETLTGSRALANTTPGVANVSMTGS
jgi:glycosyltransferase involved in cell wall biosynthesis